MPPEASPATPTAAAKPAPGATPAAPPTAAPGADSAVSATGAKPAEGAQPAKAKELAEVSVEAMKLRKARQQVKEQAAMLRTEYEAKYKETNAKLEKLAKDSETWQAERKAFLADPIEWAAKNGGALPQQAIQSFVAKGTPEAAIEAARKEAAEARAAAEELRKLREQDKADLAKEREEQAKQSKAAAEAGACKAFVRTITEEAKTYPYINALYPPEEIERKAAQFQQLAAKEEWVDEGGQKRVGRAYPFKDVANYFETSAKAAYEKRQARLAELTTPSEGDPGTATGIQMKPAPGKGRRENNGPKTGAESPPKPKPSRILSRKEQEDADRAMLRAAMAKDMADAKAPAKH